jgi:DNA-binding transcriptional MerR regulator
MDKSPDAFRTISEVAESLNLPQHVLRFWESRFPQIKPLKRGGGRRYYRPDDVELLRIIKQLLYDEGYTIKGVQRLFKEQGARAVSARATEVDNQVQVNDATPNAVGLAEGEDLGLEPPDDLSLSDAEVASLRGALADLVECERILTHARAR